MWNDSLIEIELAPTFQRRVRVLAKRYRSIRKDIEPTIQQLRSGQLVGDRSSGMGDEIFKVLYH